MTNHRIIANNGSSIVLYTTNDGNTQLEVKLEKDTVRGGEIVDKFYSLIKPEPEYYNYWCSQV